MVTLTQLHPKTHQPLKQWNFPYQSSIRVGRAQDNDIVFDRWLEVSRYHLQLNKLETPSAGAVWRLVSQGTNGTFLNGLSVKEALVRDNALIQVAREGPVLRFHIDQLHSLVCTHDGNPAGNLFCIHCGQPLVEKEEFISTYQILRVLGRGGMGTTYLGWDKLGKTAGGVKLLVIKEMNSDMSQIQKAVELFQREAKVLKTLNHPGIPKYYDAFEHDHKKYLAMELIHGQNLEQIIQKKGPVPFHQAVQWILQTCEILTYLHDLNPPLVHRDIKPANLMLRQTDKRIMLLDFGAVKEIGTVPGTRISSEGFSAPEQSRGQCYPQSDIFAIGATLIFLMTNESPLKYYQRKGIGYNFDVSRVPTIPPMLAHIIERACEPDLKSRFQSVQDLVTALKSLL